MQIRAFRSGDEPALFQVFYSAIHGTAAADYTPDQLNAWAPPIHDPERWGLRMCSIQPYVAEHAGQIIGYADLQADGYIDHFFVAATHARQGVGSQLMAHIHEMATMRGITQLYSHVSITAQPFFEKWGFVVHVQQSVEVRGITLTNYHMIKTLNRQAAVE